MGPPIHTYSLDILVIHKEKNKIIFRTPPDLEGEEEGSDAGGEMEEGHEGKGEDEGAASAHAAFAALLTFI